MAVFIDRKQLLRGIARALYKQVLPNLPEGSAKYSAHSAFELIIHFIHSSEKRTNVPDASYTSSMINEIKTLSNRDTIGKKEVERLIEILHQDTRFYKEDYESYIELLEKYRSVSDHEFKLPDEDKLSQVLRNYFGDNDAEARIIDRAVGGYSKQTVKFDYLSNGKIVQELVMRRDLPFAESDRSSVLDEFRVLEVVYSAGLPVAKPLFVEADSSILETPFLVSQRMPGRLIGDVLGLDERPNFNAEGELAHLLAQLHSIDISQFNLPGFSDVTYDLSLQKRRIEEWIEIYRENVVTPSAALEIGLSWLHANAHLVAGQSAIVHGDVGYHNILFNNDQLVALLDWELVHIGSPTEDVAYVLSFIEDRDEFLNAYENAGGRRPSEGALAYSRIFGNIRNAIYGTAGMRQFNEGSHNEVSMLPIILSTYAFYLASLDEMLSKAIKENGFLWIENDN